MGVCNCSMFCCTLLYVHSSIAIILMGKRELIALLNLSSWCLVMFERLFLAVPRGCLQFVIVVIPDHTHLLFINRHSPTMNLVEEKQRGLIPPGLQSWPLQLIEHFSNTTSVAPPPAGLPSSVPSPLVESEFYNKGSKWGLHTPI